MVLLCVQSPFFSLCNGLADYLASLYQYSRIIIHSFGHKAESKDTAPQATPSVYIETVCTPFLVTTYFHSDQNHAFVVYGVCLCLA